MTRSGLVVGADLGGTWLRVLAEDARGRRRAHREAAPAAGRLPERLRALWRRWRLDPREVEALVVASRGVWTAAERRRAAAPLRGLARRARVIADVEAACLGALGDRSGIVLLAGTGSIALGRDGRGRWARAGGLGPLVGDEGSAFWIGREWLRRAPERHRPHLAARPDAVARIAALAPRVARRARDDDRLARRIVGEAQAHLAALVLDVQRQLRLPAPVALSWAGGLLADPRLRQGVWRAVRARGLRMLASPPATGAADAALAVARGLARRSRGDAGGPTSRRPSR